LDIFWTFFSIYFIVLAAFSVVFFIFLAKFSAHFGIVGYLTFSAFSQYILTIFDDIKIFFSKISSPKGDQKMHLRRRRKGIRTYALGNSSRENTISKHVLPQAPSPTTTNFFLFEWLFFMDIQTFFS